VKELKFAGLPCSLTSVPSNLPGDGYAGQVLRLDLNGKVCWRP